MDTTACLLNNCNMVLRRYQLLVKRFEKDEQLLLKKKKITLQAYVSIGMQRNKYHQGHGTFFIIKC